MNAHSESVLSVPEEYPTVTTEDMPSPKTMTKAYVIKESIISYNSIPDEYSYSDFSQNVIDEGTPHQYQKSFHSRQQEERQKDVSELSEGYVKPMTQEEYFQMKKEQIEVIYQGNEIIYEEPDGEHRDGISTIQSQRSYSRNYNKIPYSHLDESSYKQERTGNSSPSNAFSSSQLKIQKQTPEDSENQIQRHIKVQDEQQREDLGMNGNKFNLSVHNQYSNATQPLSSDPLQVTLKNSPTKITEVLAGINNNDSSPPSYTADQID